VASGSAAAALRLKSQESGAGRFTDFSLPPLTFHEYIHLRGQNQLIREKTDTYGDYQFTSYDTASISVLNEEFKRYVNYLEAAFLVRIVNRVDDSGKKFKRANYFKIYLTNPSIRSGLFALLTESSEGMGSLVETAIFSQWFHREIDTLFYARWNNKGGEVDIVGLHKAQLTPRWCVEIKWSDRYHKLPGELKSLRTFARKSKLPRALVTTKTIIDEIELDGLTIKYLPAALYCYTVGRRSLERG
jgi:predicted AAA+ superfamily ATPase